jgi:hypothetical protein
VQCLFLGDFFIGLHQPRPRPLLGWFWQVSLAGLVNFRLAFGNYRNGHLPRKARRTRAHLLRVLVIRDKLDRQNFLVCGQHLRHFRHS